MLSELHLHTVPAQDEDTAVPPVAAVLQALAVLGELHSKLKDFGKTDPRNSPSSSGGQFRLVLTQTVRSTSLQQVTEKLPLLACVSH